MADVPVSHQLDESVLIAQAKAGDLRAFDQLVLRHQRTVFAVALRMLGDQDEAQDVAQDTFVRAYKGLSSFREQAKLSTWLVSITMNLCRNRRRWWARRRRIIVASIDEPVSADGDPREHDVPDPSPSPAHEAQTRERHQHVLAALQRLDERARTVVVLRDLEGYSYEEIAQMLGCRVGTVKSRLNRARWQLRAILDGKLG